MAGNVKILVRYTESTRYDPLKDKEVVRLVATTEKGSFHTEVPIEGARTLRGHRTAFKERVVEYIRAGSSPCEVAL
jgi:hypothetical protein